MLFLEARKKTQFHYKMHPFEINWPNKITTIFFNLIIEDCWYKYQHRKLCLNTNMSEIVGINENAHVSKSIEKH